MHDSHVFTKQFNFFDRFEEQVGHVVEMAPQNCVSDETLSKIVRIEYKGDNIGHTIIKQLKRSLLRNLY